MTCWKSSITSGRKKAPMSKRYELTVDGRTMGLYEWAQALDMNYGTIFWRYKMGWTPGQIIGIEAPPKRVSPTKGKKMPYKPRKQRSYTRAEVTINGETKTLKEWSEQYGRNYYNVYQRLKLGWNVEQALGISENMRERWKDNGSETTDLNDKGIRVLVSAIVMQAANDYRHAMIRLKKKPGDAKSLGTIKEVENFFRSSYFANMLDIDPEYLIKGLREEATNGKKPPKYSRKRFNYITIDDHSSSHAVKQSSIMYKDIQ